MTILQKSFFLSRGMYVVLAHGSKAISQTHVGPNPYANMYPEIQTWFTQAPVLFTKLEKENDSADVQNMTDGATLVSGDVTRRRWGSWRDGRGSSFSSSSDSDSSDSDSDSESENEGWRGDKKAPFSRHSTHTPRRGSHHGHFGYKGCSRKAQRRRELSYASRPVKVRARAKLPVIDDI